MMHGVRQTVITQLEKAFLLERGIREFGIGMSYGVFTGIGVAGTAIVGILLLGESVSLMKIISLAVLLCGIIGLKFVEGKEDGADSAGKSNESESSVAASNSGEEAQP